MNASDNNAKAVSPVLYILMRTDLASMNAGKAVAQGCHAAHVFATGMENAKQTGVDSEVVLLYRQWVNSTTQGYGTVITLAVDNDQMYDIINSLTNYEYFCAERKVTPTPLDFQVIHDPTYPLKDGDFTHLIPLNTCAYVFGNRNDPVLIERLGHLELMP